MGKSSKKKKKKQLSEIMGISSPLLDSLTDTIGSDDNPPKEPEDDFQCLVRRYNSRKIPHVDAGMRTVNGRLDMSREQLERFYAEQHVGEFLKAEGKFIHFEFGKMLDGYRVNTDDNNENEITRKLSYASITKQSFLNNINLTLRYVNYFIEYFDDDDELMEAYFLLMTQLHMEKVIMSVDDLIDAIFATIATESMVEKVIRMVEYNTDESLVKQDRSYDESIQLTVEHLKAIMGVSCFHKFTIPIVSHYYAIRKKELDASSISNTDLYFYTFSSFMHLFDKHYDIDLYGKLYHTATTRISKTENQESAMWQRRNRFGTTSVSFTHNLIRDYMNDISQKAIFSQSAIIFIHVCFDRAIKNELIQPDKHEMSDMKMEASDNVNETFSRFDRWQMDRTLHSEKDRLRAYVSIKDSLIRMGYDVGIDLTDTNMKKDKDIRAEYEYYQNNIVYPLSNTQMYIIQLYYSSKLQCSEDIKMMEISDMIKLIMIMKRDFFSRNFTFLPYFISSKLKPSGSRMISRPLATRMFTEHPSYEDWVEEFSDTLGLLKIDRIITELRILLSTPIVVVDYQYEELRDHEMRPQIVCVIDEFIRMLCDI